MCLFSLCFLLLHPVKILWRGLTLGGACDLDMSVSVVKMSCIPKVSSHITFTIVPWYINGNIKKHLSSMTPIQK